MSYYEIEIDDDLLGDDLVPVRFGTVKPGESWLSDLGSLERHELDEGNPRLVVKRRSGFRCPANCPHYKEE